MEEFRPEQRVRDPAHSLSRIKQAIYILRCISDRRTWTDIEIDEFDDDEQLVLIWINYLKERNYLNAFLAVTDEGYSFLKIFTHSAAGEITTLRRYIRVGAKKPNLKFYNLAFK